MGSLWTVSVPLHFVGGWGDERFSPLALERMDFVLNFFPLKPCHSPTWDLLFSLEGFFILNSLSQRASSGKVAV